jgi:ABC-type uncharacterized transport system auxiliary subunit
MIRVRLLLMLCCALALVACAGKPLPAELYYRLDAAVRDVAPIPGAPAVLIEGFDAHGLYAERALIFSRPEAQGALEQYRHQFWVEAPATMLADGLRRSLRQALGEGRVQPRSARERADWILRPRLRRLQQVLDGQGGASAEYAVDYLVTDESNAPRFVLSFEERAAAADDSPAAFAKAASELAIKANRALLERLRTEFARTP